MFSKRPNPFLCVRKVNHLTPSYKESKVPLESNLTSAPLKCIVVDGNFDCLDVVF